MNIIYIYTFYRKLVKNHESVLSGKTMTYVSFCIISQKNVVFRH
jgi:hypothetical protein